MATTPVPNTSVQFNNPNFVPPAQVQFQAGSTNLNDAGQVAGGQWHPNLSATTSPTAQGGTAYNTLAYPQPFVATAADVQSTASPSIVNPVVLNQDPIVLGKGQPVSVSGNAGSTGNPVVDVNRKVSGQIPNTNCTFRNPA